LRIGQVEFPEQRFERGDFVALFFKGDWVERQAQVVRHRRAQLPGLAVRPAAAAQHLAIDGQLPQRPDRRLREPLAVGFGDVTQRLAGAPAARKLMVLRQVIIEPANFILGDGPHRHSIQNVAFVRSLGRHHAARLSEG